MAPTGGLFHGGLIALSKIFEARSISHDGKVHYWGARRNRDEAQSNGLCPVGFYVPDWWDVHDGSNLPGSYYWKDDAEHPKGDFGFVWGCIWDDDSSWKVQYLDLSKVQEGIIKRDERFSYIELATDAESDPSEFINCNFHDGGSRVEFKTLNSFDLKSGKPISPLDL